MAGWKGTDVTLSRSSGAEAKAGSITIHNLEEDTLYDFVVFARNRHMVSTKPSTNSRYSLCSLYSLYSLCSSSLTAPLTAPRPSHAYPINGINLHNLQYIYIYIYIHIYIGCVGRAWECSHFCAARSTAISSLELAGG